MTDEHQEIVNELIRLTDAKKLTWERLDLLLRPGTVIRLGKPSDKVAIQVVVTEFNDVCFRAYTARESYSTDGSDYFQADHIVLEIASYPAGPPMNTLRGTQVDLAPLYRRIEDSVTDVKGLLARLKSVE